jgi:hypothetical protein
MQKTRTSDLSVCAGRHHPATITRQKGATTMASTPNACNSSSMLLDTVHVSSMHVSSCMEQCCNWVLTEITGAG